MPRRTRRQVPSGVLPPEIQDVGRLADVAAEFPCGGGDVAGCGGRVLAVAHAALSVTVIVNTWPFSRCAVSVPPAVSRDSIWTLPHSSKRACEMST